MLLHILEASLALLVAIIVISQIIVPGFKSEKLFPVFRKRRRLESDLALVRTEVADQELMQRIREEASKLPPAPLPPTPPPAPEQVPASALFTHTETTTTRTRPVAAAKKTVSRKKTTTKTTTRTTR
jgi:hypothetical protein